MILIRHLDKTYHFKTGDVHALRDVSLEIKQGEIFGIVGYSGAGKSTLVRCINLLERPDSGYVSVDGSVLLQTETCGGKTQVLRSVSDRELNKVRKQIGMIFQHFNLLDRSTVYENIAYPLKYSGKSKAEIRTRVLELLELVDLRDKINAYPSQLSGGQKQRVAIARALANDPKVLLSDEATSALDPEATEAVLELLKKLNRDLGLTIVLITHEMSVIKSICDRVAVMEDGRVVEEGETYNIFVSPKTKIAQKFVDSISNFGHLEELIQRRSEIIPDGVNGRLLRLTFVKDSIGETMISYISKTFQISVDIMLADVELLPQGPLGKMVVAILGTEKAISEAIDHMREKKITVEVI